MQAVLVRAAFPNWWFVKTVKVSEAIWKKNTEQSLLHFILTIFPKTGFDIARTLPHWGKQRQKKHLPESSKKVASFSFMPGEAWNTSSLKKYTYIFKKCGQNYKITCLFSSLSLCICWIFSIVLLRIRLSIFILAIEVTKPNRVSITQGNAF